MIETDLVSAPTPNAYPKGADFPTREYVVAVIGFSIAINGVDPAQPHDHRHRDRRGLEEP